MTPQQPSDDLRRLESLEEISKLLTAGDSLENSLTRIVQTARRETGMEEGNLLLIDYPNNELYMYVGDKKSNLGRIRLGDESNVLAATLANGSTKVVRIPVEISTTESVLVAPLISNGTRWGLLCVYNTKIENCFDKNSIRFIQTLANIAALLIETRSKFLLRKSETGFLAEFLEPKPHQHQSAKLLKSIANKALEVAKADVVLLYEVDDNGDVLVPPVTAGALRRPEVLQEKSAEIQHRKSAVFKILDSEEPVFADTAQKDWESMGFGDHGGKHGFLTREGIQSSAGLPIRSDQRTLGVLFVNYRTKIYFKPSLRAVLQVFSDSAALAIGHSTLTVELDKQVQQVALLNHISREIARPRISLKNILNSVVSKAKLVANCDAGICFLADDATSSLEVVATCNIKLKENFKKLPLGSGVAGEVAVSRLPKIDNSYQINKNHSKCIFEGTPVECIAGVPILWDGQLLGVVEILSKDSTHFFSDADIALLKHFADLAAVAIAKAKADSFQEALVKQSPNSIIAVDKKGRVTEFNQAAERIIGYKKDEIVGEFVGILYWEGAKEARRINRILSKKGSIARMETQVRSKNHKKVPIHLSAASLSDADERILGSIGIMEAFREGALPGKARKLVEAIEKFGASRDLKGAAETILLELLGLINAGTGILVLKEAGEWKCLAQILQPACNPDLFLKTLINCMPTRVNFWKGGSSPRPTLLPGASSSVTIPIKGENKVIGYIHAESRRIEQFGPGEDIFEVFSRQAGIVLTRLQLKDFIDKTQQGLLTSANAISAGILATSFVHELRNVLNSISISIANLSDRVTKAFGRSKGKAQSEINKSLSRIEAELIRMDELAAPIQRLAKLDLKADKKNIYFNDVLREAIGLLDSSFYQNKIKTTFQLNPELNKPSSGKGKPVLADPGQLRQVFINIMLNALASTKRGGKISVKSFIKKNYFCASFRDYGDGIKEENKSKIFDPFFSTRSEGTGLGLYVCKMIIEMNHGGSIEVWSELYKGSKFTVTIPS